MYSCYIHLYHHLYNYDQSGCTNSLPLEHYVNDSESKTIDKCHKNCLTCKGKGIDGNSNCTKCKEIVKNIFRGNCYDTCLDGTLPNSNECKCFEKKCLTCSEDSLAYDLCLTCNEREGYFEKIDDFINISNFVDCYHNPEKYFHYSSFIVLLLKNFNDLIIKERQLDSYKEEYEKFDKFLYEKEDYFYTKIFDCDSKYDDAIDEVTNVLG